MSVQAMENTSQTDFHAKPRKFRPIRSGSKASQGLDEFKHFITAEEASELSPEDFIELAQIYRAFMKQDLIEFTYREEIKKMKGELKKIQELKVPAAIKENMLFAMRDKLQTLIRCLMESKKNTSEMILNFEKKNNYSVYLGLIMKWKETKKLGIHHSATTAQLSEHLSAGDSLDNTAAESPSVTSQKSEAEEKENASKQAILENMKEENIKLEHAVMNLKQTRNFLAVAIESKRDDEMDFEDFIRTKMFTLYETKKYIEQLRQKISTKKTKKESTFSSQKLFSILKSKKDKEKEEEKKKEMEKAMESSMAKMNQSMFQDVSSRVTRFISKVLKKTGNSKRNKTGIVFTPEFLREMNLPTRVDTEND